MALLAPGSAQAQTQPVVWSATLTVDTATGDHGELFYGCDDGKASMDNCSSPTVLTNRKLKYGATTYTFTKLQLGKCWKTPSAPVPAF